MAKYHQNKKSFRHSSTVPIFEIRPKFTSFLDPLLYFSVPMKKYSGILSLSPSDFERKTPNGFWYVSDSLIENIMIRCPRQHERKLELKLSFKENCWRLQTHYLELTLKRGFLNIIWWPGFWYLVLILKLCFETMKQCFTSGQNKVRPYGRSFVEICTFYLDNKYGWSPSPCQLEVLSGSRNRHRN